MKRKMIGNGLLKLVPKTFMGGVDFGVECRMSCVYREYKKCGRLLCLMDDKVLILDGIFNLYNVCLRNVSVHMVCECCGHCVCLFC